MKVSETFSILCPSLDSQVHYFPGTCGAHHPPSSSTRYETIKMKILEGQVCHVRLCVYFALTVGGAHDRVFARLVIITVVVAVMVVGVNGAIVDVVFVVVVHKFFFACFAVDSMFVTGDMGHKLARSA